MYRKGLNIALCFAILVFTMIAFRAQANELNLASSSVVDVKISFPYDESYIDSSYMGNSKILNRVDSLLKDSTYISTIRQIVVTAQSSPEGSIAYNTRLSERRRLSLQDYFTTHYPHIDDSIWLFDAMPENWADFNNSLSIDPNLPNKTEILTIANSDRGLDQKEWLLRTLDGGRPWQYIRQHILPSQRYGASILFIPIAPLTQPFKIEKYDLPLQQFPRYVAPSDDSKSRMFAIKTNLLLDAVSVLNFAVEIPIGTRLSVVAEGVHPWWRSWNKNFTMQVESYHAELKYWLGKRTREDQLTGWSAGLYGGWGRYDVQPFGEKGVQGDLFDIGAQIGYSHKLVKQLYMEYTLGLGYINTKYNDYYMAYDTEEFDDIKVIPYPWMNNKLRSVLPTRLGVSLVWHIWLNNKRR